METNTPKEKKEDRRLLEDCQVCGFYMCKCSVKEFAHQPDSMEERLKDILNTERWHISDYEIVRDFILAEKALSRAEGREEALSAIRDVKGMFTITAVEEAIKKLQ